MMELNTAAALHFQMGFSYKEILCSLAVAVDHGKVANIEPIDL